MKKSSVVQLLIAYEPTIRIIVRTICRYISYHLLKDSYNLLKDLSCLL